jgi:ABC-type multidrug transport system fused ATPase/permease subunit
VAEHKFIEVKMESSNPIHNIFLGYLNPLLDLGYKRSLTQEDIGLLDDEARTEVVHAKFMSYWNADSNIPKEKRSLFVPILNVMGYKRQLFGLLLSLVAAGAAFGPPLILKALSDHIAEVTILPTKTLWVIIALLFVIPVFGSVCIAQSSVIYADASIVVRNILTTAIYRKVLVIGTSAKRNFSTGQILNLFSVDSQNIERFVLLFAAELFTPVQLAVALVLVYQEVGVAMFAGFGFVLFVLPLLLVAFIAYAHYRTVKNVPSDLRIKLTNEILNGIRIIKYYSWELPFVKKIDDIREKELVLLYKMNIALCVIVLLILAIPFVMPIIIFYTFAKVSHKDLDVGTAFTTLSLLGLITGPVMTIPGFLQRLVQAKVSATRILSFLLSEELEDYVLKELEGTTSNTMIQIDKGCFSWLPSNERGGNVTEETVSNKADSNKSFVALSTDEPMEESAAGDALHEGLEMGQLKNTSPDSYAVIANTEDAGVKLDATEVDVVNDKSGLNRSINTLTDISLTIDKGQLVVVVGGVGAGKSSFLSVILGDIERVQGTVCCKSKFISYHAQQAWILNATVKENILLGLEYDKARMDRAISAACLQADIDILPAGIDTEIGERGINLSGGQKGVLILYMICYYYLFTLTHLILHVE